MTELVGQSLAWSFAQLVHIVRMMYWVWVPGFLLSAFLSLKYRRGAWDGLLAHGKAGFVRAFPWALWYGVTASPRPRATLEDAHRLLGAGVSPAGVMAALVASRNLPLFLLALLTLHLGIEFAVGHVLATAAMAGAVYAGVAVGSIAGGRRTTNLTPSAPARPWTSWRGDALESPSWRALLLRRRGWARILRSGWTEVRWLWPGLAIGILAGGFVLAAGLKAWWVELADVAGRRVASDLVNAAVGPLVGALLALPPVGNLPLGTAFFKTDALAYPGLVGFILASSLRVPDLVAYHRLWGAGAGVRLGVVLYGGAVAGSLAATATFALFGFRPGHIPLFRELVDEILRWIPFAMPAGGMAM
jgi:hypothetical protein